MSKFMCIKYIAEHYGLSLDLQELMEKCFHKKCITDTNTQLISNLESEDNWDTDWRTPTEQKLNYNRYLPLRIKNIKNGRPTCSGMKFSMMKTIEEKIYGMGWYNNRMIKGLLIDGVPIRQYRVGNRVMLAEREHGKAILYNGKEYWGLKKPEIVKLLQERNIKFNKNKNKGQLVRILWSK